MSGEVPVAAGTLLCHDKVASITKCHVPGCVCHVISVVATLKWVFFKLFFPWLPTSNSIRILTFDPDIQLALYFSLSDGRVPDNSKRHILLNDQMNCVSGSRVKKTVMQGRNTRAWLSAREASRAMGSAVRFPEFVSREVSKTRNWC